MTEKNAFRSKEEELQRLTQEIADIKSTLKEISSAVGRIERHVKRSFGISEELKSSGKASGTEKKTAMSSNLPTLTPEMALLLFDELSVTFRNDGFQDVENKLQSMMLQDLKLMAQELGITLPTKPSKKALCSGIIGRLNERVMLSKNVNVTPSQKEQMQKEGKEST